jgi:hypothetical protein
MWNFTMLLMMMTFVAFPCFQERHGAFKFTDYRQPQCFDCLIDDQHLYKLVTRHI